MIKTIVKQLGRDFWKRTNEWHQNMLIIDSFWAIIDTKITISVRPFLRGKVD